MQDMTIERDGVRLNMRLDGATDPGAPAIVFANSLGTTLHLWDQLVPLLPSGLRVVRYDMRGHGKSDAPDAPYTMGALVTDAEAVCEAANVREVLFVGLSVGGLVAQGLAVKRPDLVRTMVLSNTAARIGNAKLWQERIDTVLAKGMAALTDGVMQRWFSRDFFGTPAMAPWAAMLESTPPQGYAGVSAAIAGTDFFTTTAALRLPTLGIAGSEDKATPPDLVRETTDLIPGSRFALMSRVGHLPCVEDPEGYARLLREFMDATGHLTPAA